MAKARKSAAAAPKKAPRAAASTSRSGAAGKGGGFTLPNWLLRSLIVIGVLLVVVGGAAGVSYFRQPAEERDWGLALEQSRDGILGAAKRGGESARELSRKAREKASEKTADATEKLDELAKPGPGADSPAGAVAETPDFIVARVKRIVDGDTMVVETDGSEERVRFLMVNTPESVHPDAKQNIPLGKVASDYTKENLEGKQVRLRFEPGHEQRDRFRRMLCYVFVQERNFNVELVEKGLSPYYTAFGTSSLYDDEFRAAEKRARQEGLGIWGDPELTKQYLRLKSKWGQDRSAARKAGEGAKEGNAGGADGAKPVSADGPDAESGAMVATPIEIRAGDPDDLPE